MLKMLAKFKNLSVRLSSIPDSVNAHKASKSSVIMGQNEPYNANEVRVLTKMVDGKRVLSQVVSDDEEYTSKLETRTELNQQKLRTPIKSLRDIPHESLERSQPRDVPQILISRYSRLAMEVKRHLNEQKILEAGHTHKMQIV